MVGFDAPYSSVNSSSSVSITWVHFQVDGAGTFSPSFSPPGQLISQGGSIVHLIQLPYHVARIFEVHAPFPRVRIPHLPLFASMLGFFFHLRLGPCFMHIRDTPGCLGAFFFPVHGVQRRVVYYLYPNCGNPNVLLRLLGAALVP